MNILSAESKEINFSADTIFTNPRGFIEAEGNVLVTNGEISIAADNMKVNSSSEEIKITGIRDFQHGNAVSLSAAEALISTDLSEGIINEANLVIDDTIKIQTDEVQLKNGEIVSAKGISRVTSCEECEDNKPNWYLSASSAQRDTENLNIVYKDVTVRAKGLPIAYIPYLRMPDPSVDRAIGFLVPEAVLTSNLASGLKIPYFIPLSLSNLLVTPYFSPKTKTLEYRYRRNFEMVLWGHWSIFK